MSGSPMVPRDDDRPGSRPPVRNLVIMAVALVVLMAVAWLLASWNPS